MYGVPGQVFNLWSANIERGEEEAATRAVNHYFAAGLRE